MSFRLGENLKRLRIAKKYTQEQVGQWLGVSPKAISRWECGSGFPDILRMPEIAHIYGVTVDDLYREDSIGYENYAHRLLSIYETTRGMSDFLNAEREFAKLYQAKEATMKDLCMYAILWQMHTQDCKEKALELFEKGLAMGESVDPETYHWIERQRMFFRSQMGQAEQVVAEQEELLRRFPEEANCHINHLAACLFAGKNEKALECYHTAVKKFPGEAILYVYGGNLYRRLKRYEEAFACWDRAIDRDLGFTDALWAKAECYEELEDYSSAHAVWEQIIEWYGARGYEVEAEEPKKRARRCEEKLNR